MPVFATEADIKERHRALSLVFHPDKQRDENLKEHAKERFLEVQAAYESTFYPVLRLEIEVLMCLLPILSSVGSFLEVRFSLKAEDERLGMADNV